LESEASLVVSTGGPLVSVVIPNYNYGRYLAQAIESALHQTYQKMEILVVDDGSTDDSKAVLVRYAGRLRLVEQRNLGVSIARNRGVEESRGDLVAFLDADDLWHEEKLSRQVAKFDDSAVGLVYCGLHYIDELGRSLGASVPTARGRLLRHLALLRHPGVLGVGSTALVRKQCLERVGVFDPLLSTSADWDFVRRVACHYAIDVVPEPLVFYRQHGVAMHRKVEVFERDMLYAFDRLFSDPAAADVHSLKRRAYGKLHLILAGSYFHARGWKPGLAHAARSLALWPGAFLYFSLLPLRALRRKPSRPAMLRE